MSQAPGRGEAGGIRASDAERDATVERLREAAGEGRLTLEEFSDRMEQASTAKTRAELDRLLTDLPASTDVGRAGPGGSTVAVGGSAGAAIGAGPRRCWTTVWVVRTKSGPGRTNDGPGKTSGTRNATPGTTSAGANAVVTDGTIAGALAEVTRETAASAG